MQKEKDLKSFRRAFEIFDSDGSGKINVDEMDKLIIELTTHDPTEEEVKQVFIQEIKGIKRKNINSILRSSKNSMLMKVERWSLKSL